MGCPQDQLSDVAAFSFGKRPRGAATHDVIVRLGLTRKAVSTIDPRYDENAVPPFSPHLPVPAASFCTVLVCCDADHFLPLPWSECLSDWRVKHSWRVGRAALMR